MLRREEKKSQWEYNTALWLKSDIQTQDVGSQTEINLHAVQEEMKVSFNPGGWRMLCDCHTRYCTFTACCHFSCCKLGQTRALLRHSKAAAVIKQRRRRQGRKSRGKSKNDHSAPDMHNVSIFEFITSIYWAESEEILFQLGCDILLSWLVRLPSRSSGVNRAVNTLSALSVLSNNRAHDSCRFATSSLFSWPKTTTIFSLSVLKSSILCPAGEFKLRFCWASLTFWFGKKWPSKNWCISMGWKVFTFLSTDFTKNHKNMPHNRRIDVLCLKCLDTFFGVCVGDSFLFSVWVLSQIWFIWGHLALKCQLKVRKSSTFLTLDFTASPSWLP